MATLIFISPSLGPRILYIVCNSIRQKDLFGNANGNRPKCLLTFMKGETKNDFFAGPEHLCLQNVSCGLHVRYVVKMVQKGRCWTCFSSRAKWIGFLSSICFPVNFSFYHCELMIFLLTALLLLYSWFKLLIKVMINFYYACLQSYLLFLLSFPKKFRRYVLSLLGIEQLTDGRQFVA